MSQNAAQCELCLLLPSLMHLKSLSDDSQGAGDNVAVTAFVHGSKRKVMATPEDYTVRSSSGTIWPLKLHPYRS